MRASLSVSGSVSRRGAPPRPPRSWEGCPPPRAPLLLGGNLSPQTPSAPLGEPSGPRAAASRPRIWASRAGRAVRWRSSWVGRGSRRNGRRMPVDSAISSARSRARPEAARSPSASRAAAWRSSAVITDTWRTPGTEPSRTGARTSAAACGSSPASCRTAAAVRASWMKRAAISASCARSLRSALSAKRLPSARWRVS